MRMPKKLLACLLACLLAIPLLLALFPLPAMAATVEDVNNASELTAFFSRFNASSPISNDYTVVVHGDIQLSAQVVVWLGSGGSVTIRGADGIKPTFTMTGNDRFFDVKWSGTSGEASFTVENLVFDGGGHVGVDGGAIYCHSNDTRISISALNCVFRNNIGQNGGAIYAPNISLLSGCLFEGNESTKYGGAVNIPVTIDGLIIRNCDFYGNKANPNKGGGAIRFDSEIPNIQFADCYFDGNIPVGNYPHIILNPIYGIHGPTNTSGGHNYWAELKTGRRPSYVSGDPVLPMPLPADFLCRRATRLYLYPAEGGPVVRELGYYWTIEVLRLAENGFVEARYRGQTGYVPLRDLGRASGLTW